MAVIGGGDRMPQASHRHRHCVFWTACETRSGGLTRKAKDGTWEAAESLFVTQHILRKLTTTGQAPF